MIAGLLALLALAAWAARAGRCRHAESVRERLADGRLYLRCARCFKVSRAIGPDPELEAKQARLAARRTAAKAEAAACPAPVLAMLRQARVRRAARSRRRLRAKEPAR